MKSRLLSCAAILCFAAACQPASQSDVETQSVSETPAVNTAGVEREPVEWDLTRLYPDVEAWDAARLDILERIKPLADARETFTPSATSLADLYDQSSDIIREGIRVSTYASLDSDTDLRNGEKLARRGQAQAMFAAYGEATAWISPMVQEVGETQIEAWIAAEPRLQKHAFGLRETLRMAPIRFRLKAKPSWQPPVWHLAARSAFTHN